MKIERGIIFTDEDEKQNTQNVNISQQPQQFIMEKIERKEFPLTPEHARIMTRAPGLQGQQNIQEPINIQTHDNLHHNKDLNQTAGEYKNVPLSKGVKTQEEGFTTGLKKELQNHTTEGRKDITEIAKLEGTEEAVKQTVIETERQKERLDDLVDNTQTILLRIKTIFPFDLFPDDIAIDPIKISIAYRMIFGSTSIKSIPLKDITDVEVGTTPFFSMLRIVNNKEKIPVVIKPLKKKDALRAANILQGLLFAQKQDVDITRIPIQDSVHKIETLGKAQVAI